VGAKAVALNLESKFVPRSKERMVDSSRIVVALRTRLEVVEARHAYLRQALVELTEKDNSNTISTPETATRKAAAADSTADTFTWTELARSNSLASKPSWIVIHGKVYNVGKFRHPGGRQILRDAANSGRSTDIITSFKLHNWVGSLRMPNLKARMPANSSKTGTPITRGG
jgi:cytochrome b involved in lipid metabolism